MKRLVLFVAVVLVVAASSYACTDQICQLVRCPPPNQLQNGWILQSGAGWQDTIGSHGGSRCALACFPQQCWASISPVAYIQSPTPEVSCDNPDSIGAIAFVNPNGDGILLLKNIKLSNFESYTTALEKLAVTDGVPFDQLAHAVQVSSLPFAKKDIIVYSTYEAYKTDLHTQLQEIYAKALWQGTHKNGN